MEKKKCPHCGYEPPIKLFEKHKEHCDDNPKNKPIKGVPQGIGGWMIFPIFIFFISMIRYFYDIYISWEFIGEILFQMIIFIDVIIIIFIIYALSLIFAESYKAPLCAIIVLCINLIVSIITYGFSQEGNIFGYVIGTIIWIFYFTESKRVQNTFIK